ATRRASSSASTSASTATRPAIEWSPPANRRIAVTSATRTVGGALRMLTSSALTSVVSATGLLEKLDASDRDANNQFTGPGSRRLLPAEIAMAHADRDAGNFGQPLR